jgi:predicted HAD superfamily Cof-like phosphohydrolase
LRRRDHHQKLNPQRKPVHELTDQELVKSLEDGVSADIWYDAGEFDDGDAKEVIERLQASIREAANRMQAYARELQDVTAQRDALLFGEQSSDRPRG